MLEKIFLCVKLTLFALPCEVVKLLYGRFLSRGMDAWYTQMLGSVMEDIGWNAADYAGSQYSLGYVKQWYRSRLLDILKDAQKGRKAPDCDVVALKDNILVKLLSYGRPGRPLVLNFGSCT